MISILGQSDIMGLFYKVLHTIEVSFNSKEFGRVLLVIPSIFGKLEVHVSEVVWRFEPITFHIGELKVKLILAMSVKKICIICVKKIQLSKTWWNPSKDCLISELSSLSNIRRLDSDLQLVR